MVTLDGLARKGQVMLHCLLLLLLFAFIGRAATGAELSYRHSDDPGTTDFVRVSGVRFLDPTGKPITFHGINICNKSKDQGYTSHISAADFAQIRSWGMNAVRLCIFWDGLEPRPGYFDKAYVDRIAHLVDEAKQQGLYVLLDMHQDLFSIKFGDGAPVWATIDDGKPHTKVDDWNDAYYVSEDVQAALDHFWSNSPGPDGVGLQDHYAEAWQFVAKRFQDEPAILGYDLMNEPFPGQKAASFEHAMLTRLSTILAKRPGVHHPSPEDLLRMEATDDGRRKILSWMQSISIFKSMLQAGSPYMQEFDRSQLMPMYTKVAKAIRQADSRHILFLEPDMSTNLGVRTAIAPLLDDSGRRDSQQAYSPHVYDIVTDTSLLDLMSVDRIKLTFGRDQQFSHQTQMPVLVGEWGAFYLNPAAVGQTRAIKHVFDRADCSEMFWAYRPTLVQWSGITVLKRTLESH
jgi:endoglycosylceramidase